jgi:hypothetical protein
LSCVFYYCLNIIIHYSLPTPFCDDKRIFSLLIACLKICSNSSELLYNQRSNQSNLEKNIVDNCPNFIFEYNYSDLFINQLKFTRSYVDFFLIWLDQEEGMKKIPTGHFLSFAIYSPLFHHFSIIYVHVLFIWAFMKENSIAITDFFMYIHTSTHIIRPQQKFHFSISFSHPFFWISTTTKTNTKDREFFLFIYLFIFSFLCWFGYEMLYICGVGDEYYSVCIAYVSIQCWDPN